MADVGADIESLCRKCGDVWHVIVAKVGAQIAKVQCKQCGGLHRYRPPNDAAVVRERRTNGKRAEAAPKQRPLGKSTASTPLIVVDTSKPIRAYRIDETFAAGDRLEHRMFGEGVVEMLVGPQKIQVFFADGRRILAHDRRGSSLAS